MDKVWIILDGGDPKSVDPMLLSDSILEVWDDREACLKSYKSFCTCFPDDEHFMIEFPIFKVGDIDQ